MGKAIIVGVGVQGSTIAKHLDTHPEISGLILADYNLELATRLSASLNKLSASMNTRKRKFVTIDGRCLRCA